MIVASVHAGSEDDFCAGDEFYLVQCQTWLVTDVGTDEREHFLVCLESLLDAQSVRQPPAIGCRLVICGNKRSDLVEWLLVLES